MPTTEKKSIKTVGQFLAVHFHCDDPASHADNVIHCWLSVLSNLDDEEGHHLTYSEIRILSEFVLDYKRAATSGHAHLSLITMD